MAYLKNLALAAALGLSLSANSMYASPAAKKAEPSLSLKTFNQVIKGYDSREFIDSDGDKIDSAADARDVAHTTTYKIGGEPIARAIYDDDGRIVRLEKIVQSAAPAASAPKPAAAAPSPKLANESGGGSVPYVMKGNQKLPCRVTPSVSFDSIKTPAAPKPAAPAKSYNIDWKRLDAVLADPECKGSVHDLYKFGLGISTYEQRKQLIRDYFKQRDYDGTGPQNEAHYEAFSRVVQERDEAALGPLYEAAESLASKKHVASKPVPKTAYKPASTKPAVKVAPAPVADNADDYCDGSCEECDNSAPSQDLEQRLYNTPAQPSAASPAQPLYGARGKKILAQMRAQRAEREADSAPSSNSYGRAEQNPALSQSATGAATGQKGSRRYLGGRTLAEISARSQARQSARPAQSGSEGWNNVDEAAASFTPGYRTSYSSSAGSIDDAVSPTGGRHLLCKEGASRSATSLPASMYDATRRAVHRVVERSWKHQGRGISEDLWTPLYSSLMRHNEPYRFLPNGNLDFHNTQFEAAMSAWITKYQMGGTQRFGQKEWSDYGLARDWINDAFAGSARLQRRFQREADYQWSPISGQHLDDFAMRQTYFEFYSAQQEFWHDHQAQNRKKALGFLLRLGIGFAIGNVIGGHGGHAGGHAGGSYHGFTSGGSHFIPPGVGNAFR